MRTAAWPAVVGRGRKLPLQDDEAGLDASTASKQLALDRGEEVRQGVKPTRGAGSTAAAAYRASLSVRTELGTVNGQNIINRTASFVHCTLIVTNRQKP